MSIARASETPARARARPCRSGGSLVGPQQRGGRGLAGTVPSLQRQQRVETLETLQRECGNASVVELLSDHGGHRELAVGPVQRDDANPSTGRTPSPGVPRTLRMRDPLDNLRANLERAGRGDLWRLLAGQPVRLSAPFDLPRIVPERQPAPPGQPTRLVFGPLSGDSVLRALTSIPDKPDWLTRALRPREARERTDELYVVYENDGVGFPNEGSGTDQGRTAGFGATWNFNKQGLGITRVGLTAMEMITPRGKLRPGDAFGPESTYETGQGQYSGILAADIGVTVSRSRKSRVEILLRGGIDSREWGKVVQDFIHQHISHSPLFPWPTGTKPLVEGGVNWHHSIDNLYSKEFAGLKYRGRLELEANAITGTRRSEGTMQARFVIRTAEVQTPVGPISVEFSPVGALVRGFVRYNDGREAPLPGVEAGVNSSLMVNIGRVGIGLRGEAILSTDPAFQTGTDAGSHPTALKASPFVGSDGGGYGMPAGHHGSGQLIFKLEW